MHFYRKGAIVSLSNVCHKINKIQGLIEAKAILSRRTGATDKPKYASFQYFIKNNQKLVLVCRQAFMKLYAVSHIRVQRFNMLLNTGETPKNICGKHNSRLTLITEEFESKK